MRRSCLITACFACRHVRGWIAQRRLTQQRKAAVQVQAFWRMHLHQSRFIRLKEATSILQASVAQPLYSCLSSAYGADVLVPAALCSTSQYHGSQDQM